MKKRLAAVFGVIVALAAVSLPAMSASADTTDEGLSSLATELSPFWTDHGVSTEVQASLLDNLDAGMLPDSLAGAEPVSTAVTETDALSTTVFTYADGSVSVSTAERGPEASGGIAPRDIQSCQVSSGSGFVTHTGCYVSGDNGIVVLGFRADYTSVQGGNDYIANSGYDQYQNCAPGTCSTPELNSYTRDETSAASPAELSYKTVYNYGAGTVTNFTRLTVGQDTASSSFS